MSVAACRMLCFNLVYVMGRQLVIVVLHFPHISLWMLCCISFPHINVVHIRNDVIPLARAMTTSHSSSLRTRLFSTSVNNSVTRRNSATWLDHHYATHRIARYLTVDSWAISFTFKAKTNDNRARLVTYQNCGRECECVMAIGWGPGSTGLWTHTSLF